MTERTKTFARDATGLTRSIGGFDSLVMNLAFMGFGYAFIYLVYAEGLYPGVNLPLSVLVALIYSLFLATVYYLLCVAMPRTGGDYVWVSRSIHPSLGLMSNIWYMVNMLTFIGIAAVWVIQLEFGPLLWSMGQATGEAGFASMSAWLQTPINAAVVASILVLACTIPLLVGTRTTFRVTYLLYAIVFIGFAVFVGIFLSAGHDTIVSRMQELTGMTPSQVISTAQAQGYGTAFTLSGTVLGAVYAVLNLNGYVASVYFGGEVKRGERSQLVGIFGSLILFAFLLIVFYEVIYNVVGADLIGSLSYLFLTGNSAFAMPVGPWGHSLLIFATGNTTLLIIGNMAFLFTLIAGLISTPWVASRMLFAWSFDRIIPTKFTELGRRFKAPTLIYLLIAIGAVFSVFLYLYTSALSYLVYSITGYGIIYSLACVVAIILPYRKKDVFEQSPAIVKRKVGGIPLLTLVGVVGLLGSIALTYATLTPAFVGAPINPIYVGVVVFVTAFGIAAYYLSYFINKSRGVDLTYVFKEIPPE